MRNQRTTPLTRRAMARRYLLTWAVGMAVLTALWAAGAPAAVLVAWTVAYGILVVVR